MQGRGTDSVPSGQHDGQQGVRLPCLNAAVDGHKPVNAE